MPDEILPLLEVAHLLKVAEKFVCPIAQKAARPAFKVGEQWGFRRNDIDARIEKQKAARESGKGRA